MNIFYTDKNPRKAAMHLDNKRLIKMILESCQIMCSVLNQKGLQSPYKSTHLKHPSILWVNESSANFQYLIDYTEALLEIYENKFQKIHKCKQVLKEIKEIFKEEIFQNHKITPIKPAINAPIEIEEHYHLNILKFQNPILAYRIFLANKKNLNYKGLKIPFFIKKYRLPSLTPILI